MIREDDLKKAWSWLKVTTSYQTMMACPAQKAILIAIARNQKKPPRHSKNRRSGHGN